MLVLKDPGEAIFGVIAMSEASVTFFWTDLSPASSAAATFFFAFIGAALGAD